MQPNPSQPSNVSYVSLSIPNLGLWAALDNAELQERFKDWWPNLLTLIFPKRHSIISLFLSTPNSVCPCMFHLTTHSTCSMLFISPLFVIFPPQKPWTLCYFKLFITPPFRTNVFISFCAVGLLSLHYCFLLLLAQGSCYFQSRCNRTQEATGKASGCENHTATRASCPYKERKRKEDLRRQQGIKEKKN